MSALPWVLIGVGVAAGAAFLVSLVAIIKGWDLDEDEQGR